MWITILSLPRSNFQNSNCLIVVVVVNWRPELLIENLFSSFQQLNMKIGFLAVPVTFVSVFAIGEDTKPYQPVLFPDEFEQLKNGDSTNKIKLFSETSQIWDFNVEEYPLTQIQNILERDSSLLSYFLRSSSEDLCPGCVDTRFLPEEEDENICEERSRYIFPKGANNTKEKFMFIVNLDDRAQFRQKVKVTTCLNPGGSCGRGDLVLEDIETSCRQAFSEQKLLALSDNGKELVVDTFRFPSCCICKFRKVGFWGERDEK